MFRVSLLVLVCLAFSAQADECCGERRSVAEYIMAEPARRRQVVHVQKQMKLVRAEPEVEYVTESMPMMSTSGCGVECEPMEIEEVEQIYEAPKPAHYEQPAPAPVALPPKISIEITQIPQLVTEPAPIPTPAHYDSCRHPNGCQEPVREAYVEEKEYVPVKLEKVRTQHVQRVMHVRPVHHEAVRYVQEAAPCETVCHTSAGCCQ